MRNAKRMILTAALLSAPLQLQAQDPFIQSTRMDAADRFEVISLIPADSDHASLEILVPSLSPEWRTMLTTPTGQPNTRVTFRLPRLTEAKGVIARVRVDGVGESNPELIDPDLISVQFLGGGLLSPQITQINTETGTAPVEQYEVPAGTNALRVWTGETNKTEAYFDVYLSANGTVTKLRLSRWEGRLLRMPAGTRFGLSTVDGRALTIAPDVAPAELTTAFPVSGTAACDKGGVPLWNPAGAHVQLPTGQRAFEISSDGTERIVFVSEFDGTRWSPAQWVRLPAAGGVRVHSTYGQVALANYDGAALSVKAPSGATIGGVSQTMHLELPPFTGTSLAVTNVTELKAAMAVAVRGDEIVLADGVYPLDFDVSATSFGANLRAGMRGMEGIVIRSQSGNRDNCRITAANASTGNWQINHSGARFNAALVGISFDFSASPSSTVLLYKGKWLVENCRFTGSAANHGLAFRGDTGSAGEIASLDCLDVQADSAGGDCFSMAAGAPGRNRCRFINCVGLGAGATISDKVFESNTGLDCDLYGGRYGNAFVYAIASDDSTRIGAYFVKTEAAGRLAKVQNVNVYGATLGGSGSSELSLRQNGYVATSKVSLGINETFDSKATIVGNWLSAEAGSSPRGYSPIPSSTATFSWNVITNWTEAGIRIGTGTGTTTIGLSHCTFVQNNDGLNAANNNAALLVDHGVFKGNTRSVVYGTTAAQRSSNRYNLLDSAPTTGFTAGVQDVTGADPAIDALYLPVAGGNCEGSGDAASLDWVGGADAWGFPLRQSSTSTDRGARSRPRLISGAELLPNYW